MLTYIETGSLRGKIYVQHCNVPLGDDYVFGLPNFVSFDVPKLYVEKVSHRPVYDDDSLDIALPHVATCSIAVLPEKHDNRLPI